MSMAVSEPLRKNVTPVRVVALRDGTRSERGDALATEEPMEIRAHGPGQEAVRVAVTMRTPGGDFELAVEGRHGPKEARGSYNGGSESLHCETVNGSIRLKTR